MMKCPCCTRHIPKPTQLVNSHGVELCPTSAINLSRLMLEWDEYGHEPPGSVLKHYSNFVQRVAKAARS